MFGNSLSTDNVESVQSVISEFSLSCPTEHSLRLAAVAAPYTTLVCGINAPTAVWPTRQAG